MDDRRAPDIYGLIGYPVKHSFSPTMQNAAFAQCGIRASYQLFEVAPEKLDEFLRETIFEKGIRGFNVTLPHKERVYAYLTGETSEPVQRLKAVNTVRVEADRSLSGFNTDGPGFALDLKHQNVDLLDKRVALIGAGGGAKSIAVTVARHQARRLYIYDVDLARSENLVSLLREHYPCMEAQAVYSAQDLKLDDADILINATPVGMKESDPLLIGPETLHRGLFVYDLIYNPVETKLLRTARQYHCPCANGLGMLLYQGCLAFEHWMGKKAPVEAMRKALEGQVHA